ncbi:MAG TPA: SDR family oxidoreductase [Candidatus Caenarcaniphilales bacterium]|jgi:short-subunit dehydrogenase
MAPTVLITGASQGIGKATALLFARQGYNLILAARHAEPLEAVAQEIQQLDRSALSVPTDVKDSEQVKTLVQKALDHYGAVDVLINNAGIYVSGPVEQFSLEDWHNTIDLNFWGYIHTIQTLLPHFLARGSGTIVNISSIGGKVPLPYVTPYCASKFAITGLTKSLHAELSPKGIQVCGIYPNLIKSDFMERAIFRGQDDKNAQARRDQLNMILKAPVVEKPEDVAKAIWDAVEHKKPEVLVGSANLGATVNRVFPGLMQWFFRQSQKL